ncbi:hypothetical protein H6G00_01870 [Leptolyngbya sp. FACHB-541]|uniref:hypothetical protein n=1 Tax=Leptolyngbya sp. FACHB-541 TaxID=2692810 RepID=UPI00168A37CB|nr:hypothetical protein [Leptolyngbya sp. FACHB-541]MBD1995379.1 hypothetical protein [Leptolyngbya sp. FACHB-541]
MLPFSNEDIQLWRGQLIDALQPEKFRSWLLRHGAGEIVGLAGGVCTCPLHCYLAEVLPWLDASVGKWQINTFFPFKLNESHHALQLYYFADFDKYPPVPQWVTLFVGDLDSQYGHDPVTASQALAVLDSIAQTVTVH